MRLEEKQTIAATARALIGLLQNCDDEEFVDKIIECVRDGYDTPLRERRLRYAVRGRISVRRYPNENPETRQG